MHGFLKNIFVAAPLLALVTLLSTAQAQSWPAKPVRVIVPHPPGGPGDVPPRGMTQALSQSMGQSFILENREGADGLIGAEACMKAAPDGYTFCATSAGVMMVNPMLRVSPSYDLTRFTAVVHTGTLQQLMLAHPSVPGNTMKEVLAAAKAKPGAITVGTFGGINLASLFVEWNKSQGIEFYPIPYKSATQGAQAAIAGDVHIVSFAAGPGFKMVQAGKMKALALSPKRADVAPGVPGLRESGIGFDFNTWWGWFAPAGLPRDITRRMNAEIAKLIAEPQFHAKFIASQGLATDHPTGASPEEFEKFIRAEQEEFARLVKMVGIKPQ
jgi:tripartite-type tricarboxylate transporter receptor subunit TctC